MKKETETMDEPKPVITNGVKKMKQGMSYTGKEKTIILNVFKYFCTEYPDKCITELVRRTSRATGCSEKSIFHFRKEELRPEGFKEPSKTKVRKHVNINSRDIKYDGGVRQAIKNIIYDLRYKNQSTSLSMILKQIGLDASLPTFSVMTLRRLLMDMGFYYVKIGTKSMLVERHDEVKKDNLNSDKKKRNSNSDGKKVNASDTKISNQLESNGSEVVKNSNEVNSDESKVFCGEVKISGVDVKIGFNQPGVNVYNNYNNGCNQYEFPVHENHRYPMDFYQNHHAGGLLGNRIPLPPHMVQPAWNHPENSSILGLPHS